MVINPRTPTFWLALLSATLFIMLGVVACARVAQPAPGQSPFPTLGATVQPGATGQPAVTAQPGATGQPVPTLMPTAQPTAQPSAQPAATAQPTAQPAATAQTTAQPGQPAIGFNPQAGGPGSVVQLFGSGYAPGKRYVVRLGAPQPVGEVLFSAQADASGRWSGSFTMPANLPSGQPIASGQLFLVAMDDQNKALASAPFAFTAAPAPAYPQTPQDLVAGLLNAFRTGGDVRPYVSPAILGEINAGRPAHQVLGLHPVALNSFSFGELYGYPATDIVFLPATLNYQGFSEEHIFTVGIDDAGNPAQAKVYGRELAREGRPVATGAEDVVGKFLLELWADRSGRRALPYLAGDMRAWITRGQSVDLLEPGGVGPMLPLNSSNVDGTVATENGAAWVKVGLDLGSQVGLVRYVKAQQIDGIWRVVALAGALPGQPAPTAQPVPTAQPTPAAYPGAGWTAWKSGDFNGDGFSETVYLKESGAVNHDRLDDPLLSADSLNASAVLVVQTGPQNIYPVIEIDGQSVRFSDGHSLSFTSADSPNGPAFFQVAVSYAYEGRFLHILPLTSDGYAYAQGLAFKWQPAVNAYRPIGGPNGEW